MTAVHFIPQTTNTVIDGLITTTLTLIVAVVVLVLLLLAFLIPYLLRKPVNSHILLERILKLLDEKIQPSC
jgi:hypothetical protein